MNRRVGALACIGLTLLLGGCGDAVNSSLLNETGVKECLANAAIRELPSGTARGGSKGYAPLFAADFTAFTADGIPVNVVVQGSARRAAATAADVRSSLQSLGRSRAETADRVISAENVVAVFGRQGSAEDRTAVRRCETTQQRH